LHSNMTILRFYALNKITFSESKSLSGGTLFSFKKLTNSFIKSSVREERGVL
jgi:hypothetical protein